MTTRIDQMVGQHDKFILRDHSRDWRRIAWVVPVGEGEIDLHACLQRQKLVGVVQPYSSDGGTQLYMLCVVGEVVVESLSADTPVAQLAAIANEKLDRMERHARAEMEKSQCSERSIAPTRGQPSPQMGLGL